VVQDPPAAAPGGAIRVVRQRRRMTLRVLSERTGLSESFLSQLERGLTEASVASIRRIADALDLLVTDLFRMPDDPSPRVLVKADRPHMRFGEGATKYLLTSRAPTRNVEVLQATIEAGGSTGTQAYAHGDSDELLIVSTGEVQVELGDEVFRLEVGDSIFYPSSRHHRVINAGADACELIWVISPPSY
jgi:mannose-6-phosphate isomerase-like protein (cupin superfamily)